MPFGPGIKKLSTFEARKFSKIFQLGGKKGPRENSSVPAANRTPLAPSKRPVEGLLWCKYGANRCRNKKVFPRVFHFPELSAVQVVFVSKLGKMGHSPEVRTEHHLHGAKLGKMTHFPELRPNTTCTALSSGKCVILPSLAPCKLFVSFEARENDTLSRA